MSDDPFQLGLELARSGRWFDAHEELELAWRAAEAPERDFYQGLVHVVVAWYQAGRGNQAGCGRQLEKAHRRLSPYAPRHRGVAVGVLLADVERARRSIAAGTLALGEPQGFQQPLEADPQPPVAVEEEQ